MGGAARRPKSCVHTPGPSHGGRWRAAPSPQRRPGRLDRRGSIGWSFRFPQMAATRKAFQKILALVTGTRTRCDLEEPSVFLKDGLFLKGSNAHLELPAADSVTWALLAPVPPGLSLLEEEVAW